PAPGRSRSTGGRRDQSTKRPGLGIAIHVPRVSPRDGPVRSGYAKSDCATCRCSQLGMQSPLVTVIIPTFNRRQWISICLDSVKAQTYPHIETLVIDDGSSDGTVEWLRSQPEYSFARVHEQPKNGGASVARNDGIRLARGELIAFIDSDDALLPNHVETA